MSTCSTYKTVAESSVMAEGPSHSLVLSIESINVSFSYYPWDLQGKNTEVVCYSLLLFLKEIIKAKRTGNKSINKKMSVITKSF